MQQVYASFSHVVVEVVFDAAHSKIKVGEMTEREKMYSSKIQGWLNLDRVSCGHACSIS